MEFRSVMNQKKKSEMVIFLMWAHLPLERLGRYTMLTAQKIALTASSVAHYEVFIFHAALKWIHQRLDQRLLLFLWSYYTLDSRWAARCGNSIRTKTQMYLTNNKHVAESLLSTEQIYTTKSKMWALQGHNLFQQNKWLLYKHVQIARTD